ncbi:hypothetical protein Tco_1200844 [Tanacetum coccineum]
MSSSSTVIYTSVYTDFDPRKVFWGADEELSDGGSLRVIVYGYEELPMQPVAPPSPNYIPGPEEPHAPLPPNFVPEPVYPEFLVPSNAEASMEEQLYAANASPTALLPGYVADSDPEEDLEEDPEEEDHADGGDDDDEPSDDDDNDDSSDDNEEEEEAEEEEKEHMALADSVVAPFVDHVPSSKETNPFESDESVATPPSPPAYCTTARISIRPEAPMPFSSEEEVERLLALPTSPPSPLISVSPPSVKECLARCLAAPTLPSPPLPPLPSSPLPLPIPASLPLPSPPLPPLPSSPLPPLPASLFIPSIDRREDIPKAKLPPHKRLYLTTPTLRYEVGDSLTTAPRPTRGHRVDYGFIGTLDAEVR